MPQQCSRILVRPTQLNHEGTENSRDVSPQSCGAECQNFGSG